MGLKIERKNDVRFVKAILHRVADIPGGVSVQTAVLGGSVLKEGTPMGPTHSGFYGVLKTATLAQPMGDDDDDCWVNKGHHFKVGDHFATENANGKQITSINKNDPERDYITLSATLGVAIPVGTTAFQSAAANKLLKVTPTCIAGSSYEVEVENNLFVDAWLIAVTKESVSPAVDASIKTALKGVHYISETLNP